MVRRGVRREPARAPDGGPSSACRRLPRPTAVFAPACLGALRARRTCARAAAAPIHQAAPPPQEPRPPAVARGRAPVQRASFFMCLRSARRRRWPSCSHQRRRSCGRCWSPSWLRRWTWPRAARRAAWLRACAQRRAPAGPGQRLQERSAFAPPRAAEAPCPAYALRAALAPVASVCWLTRQSLARGGACQRMWRSERRREQRRTNMRSCQKLGMGAT